MRICAEIASESRSRTLAIAVCSVLLITLNVSSAIAQHATGGRGKAIDKTLTVNTKLAHDRVCAGTASSGLIFVTIKSGWHINAPNPADASLIGTSLEIPKHKILDSVSVRYLPGVERKFDYAESPLEVYEEGTTILIHFSVASDARQGNYAVPVFLNYQACSENVCLAPTSIRFNIPIRVALPGTKVRRMNAESFEQYELQPK